MAALVGRFVGLVLALVLWTGQAPGGHNVASAAGPTGTVPPLPPGMSPSAPRVAPGMANPPTPAAAATPRPELLRRVDELQRLGATDPVALPARFAHPGAGPALFAPMLAHDAVRSVPFVWRSFFPSALAVFGRERAGATWVGFYNPLVDLWLMTEWMDGALARPALPGAPGVTKVWLIAGETLRDVNTLVQPEPVWRDVPNVPPPVALLRLGPASLRAAHAAERVGTLPGLAASARGGPEYTGRALRRLVDFAGLLLILDADGMRESVAVLRAALAGGGALTARFPSVDAGDAARLAAVPTAIRSRLEVTSFIPTADGMVLTLGIPRLGRWVLVAQYLDAPSGGLALRRLVLVDVADVGAE